MSTADDGEISQSVSRTARRDELSGFTEQAFAKIKALLQKKPAARTVDGLWLAITEATDAISPDECRNLFVNAGYDPC